MPALNMPALEFWFEFASTYSYPAAMRIEALARASGVPLQWKPFLLGPIFQAQGLSSSPFSLYPAKGRYMWRDVERVCHAQGLPWRRPSTSPRNGLLAARLACVHADADWLPAFVRRVYQANFVDDLDIADPGVITTILSELGLPATMIEVATAPATKQALRAQCERAAVIGLFGAPSFVVGEEIFWGNDRLEAALDWAVAARAS